MSCGDARGRLAAGEREQVADDAGGAAGLLGDAPQVVAHRLRRARRVAGAPLALEQLREADDARQRVVQLVRDAGDELADRRQLLRLQQLRLRRLQPIERRGQLRVGLAQLVAERVCSRRAERVSSVTFFATCTTDAPAARPPTGNVVTLRI